MDEATPRATAVAVQDGDIIAVGELDDVVTIVGDDHEIDETFLDNTVITCLLYTSPSPRDLSTSRMPSSA